MVDPQQSRTQQLRAQADSVLERHEAGDVDGALAATESLIHEAQQADQQDEVVRETLFMARFEQAVLLTEFGELAAAAAAYAEAEAVPTDVSDPDQRHEIAMARLNRGILHDALGSHGEAIRAYEQLIGEFGDADDPVTVDQVHRARVNRAAAYLNEGRVAAAIGAADWLVARLDGRDPGQAEQLAMAVRIRGAALRAQNRLDEAVAAFDDIDRCVAQAPAVRGQVLTARVERARALHELGDDTAAIDLIDGEVEEFPREPELLDARQALDALVAELRS